MQISQVLRHGIVESADGGVEVPVVTVQGKVVRLELPIAAASDLSGGLYEFFEEWGARQRAAKAAAAKKLIAAGVDRATVIKSLDILSESWLARALAGAFDQEN